MSDAATTAPLAGVRVANFGWVWAGPVAGQTLAFMGADVVKIESRTRIDLTRAPCPRSAAARPDRTAACPITRAGPATEASR